MEDHGLTLQPQDYGLLTDLYELTMAACYCGENLEERWSSFELCVRRLPPHFGYLVAMGLTQALHYLENLRFSSVHIEALKATGSFSHAPERFWRLLETARFSGDVWAVPEGTVVFAHEPLMRVEGPLWLVQIAETYLLNTLNYQTLIATRAARLRDVAGPNKTLLEFGTRRAFSPQGALWAVRAALAGGLDGTSNVLGALKLGQKPVGTMAHALVMAIAAVEGSEMEAFQAFHRYFPGAPLLIDTYDTVGAAQRLAHAIEQGRMEVRGVRIDSGDLVTLSQQVRQWLPEVPIFASGDIDEWEIARLQASGACIDGYGIGTRLVTGAPVNGVYKLVDIQGIPVMKESSGKSTYPGRKQIFRRVDQEGRWVGDRLGLASETPQTGEQPLLQLVWKQGERVNVGGVVPETFPEIFPETHPEPLVHIRERTTASVAHLPPSVRRIENPETPPVEISLELRTLTEKIRHHGVNCTESG